MFLSLFICKLVSLFSFVVAETAMNIGYSCNMLRDDMDEVFVISGHSSLEVARELR